MSGACRVCAVVLRDGDLAWADDWKVIDVSGERVTFRTEVRFVCDSCHESEAEVPA